MFTLEIENTTNNKITLTQDEQNYQIVSVTGLEPPKANVYTNVIANMDGAKYKSSKMDMRNVVITVKINNDVELNRQNLFSFFRSGQWCKIYFSNTNRSVYCEGYVETISVPLFVKDERMQISIVCPNPYWKSLEEIVDDISKVYSNFEFPFAIGEEGKEFSVIDLYREVTILNQSEIEGGMILTLQAQTDDVENPTIYDSDTGQFIKLNITLNEGDIVIINTNKGEKSVTLIVDGIKTNAINYFATSSTWLQLKLGLNHFTYNADSNVEFLKVTLAHNILYEGV